MLSKIKAEHKLDMDPRSRPDFVLFCFGSTTWLVGS